MLWYYYIAAFIHCRLAPMRATRRDNLDILAEMARAAMPELTESRYQRKKRIRRFVSNDNFVPMAAQCALIPAIWWA